MPATSAVPYAMSIGLRPGYFGGHFLGAQHNPFETGGDPNAANFTVQNLNLAAGLTLDRLEDRRALVKHFDTRSPRASTQLADVAGDGPLRAARRYEFVTGAGRPQGVRHQQGRPAAARPLRPQHAGARARCWPGGWSRPARRSSPSTSAAGTITGICRRATRTTCRRSMRWCRRCSTTSTTAACSTRRWSCCAASSAARRR